MTIGMLICPSQPPHTFYTVYTSNSASLSVVLYVLDCDFLWPQTFDKAGKGNQPSLNIF